jgi:hypothetical protein
MWSISGMSRDSRYDVLFDPVRIGPAAISPVYYLLARRTAPLAVA